MEYLLLATASFTALTAVLGFIGLLRGKKRDDQILNLTLRVDGRLTELLEVSKTSSHAEGKLEGVAEEKANASPSS